MWQVIFGGLSRGRIEYHNGYRSPAVCTTRAPLSVPLRMLKTIDFLLHLDLPRLPTTAPPLHRSTAPRHSTCIHSACIHYTQIHLSVPRHRLSHTFSSSFFLRLHLTFHLHYRVISPTHYTPSFFNSTSFSIFFFHSYFNSITSTSFPHSQSLIPLSLIVHRRILILSPPFPFSQVYIPFFPPTSSTHSILSTTPLPHSSSPLLSLPSSHSMPSFHPSQFLLLLPLLPLVTRIVSLPVRLIDTSPRPPPLPPSTLLHLKIMFV